MGHALTFEIIGENILQAMDCWASFQLMSVNALLTNLLRGAWLSCKTSVVQMTYQQLLKREFEQRVHRNGSYSLRAFAKSLGLTAPHLSAVLKEKKGLSLDTAEKIGNAIRWNEEEIQLFKTLVKARHARKKTERLEAAHQARELVLQKAFQGIQLDQFNLISDWHHFAILHLFEMEKFCSEVNWIADKLSLQATVVTEALERLEKLGFIDRSKPDWKIKRKFNATPNVPSLAIRNNHHQVLRLAGEALENQPIESRDFSSVFMAIDNEMLPEAKVELKKFRRRFCQNLDVKKKNALYCLSIQFFELSKPNQRTQ